MGRLALIVLIVASSAAVALAIAPPPPGSTAGCPLSDAGAATSDRPGADSQLIPDGATRLLVCDYSGFTQPAPRPNQSPAHRLIGSGLVTDAGQVSQLADQLNAIPNRTGAYSCPADFGNQLVAYFRYGSGLDDPVTIGLSGCQSITNGHVQRLGLDAPVVTQTAKLAQPATIAGRVQVCGGPAPGGCRTETAGACGPAHDSCSRTDRVDIFVAGGPRLVTVPLDHARFSAYVPAGRYKLELLADGKHVHGRVVQTGHATARAGRTTRVVFGISVP